MFAHLPLSLIIVSGCLCESPFFSCESSARKVVFLHPLLTELFSRGRHAPPTESLVSLLFQSFSLFSPSFLLQVILFNYKGVREFTGTSLLIGSRVDPLQALFPLSFISRTVFQVFFLQGGSRGDFSFTYVGISSFFRIFSFCRVGG